MPELRQNLATKEWVIIATERAARPLDLRMRKRKKIFAPPERSADCPFCPGNSSKTAKTTYFLGSKDDWRVRVVENKYPALIPGSAEPSGAQTLYRVLPGEGIHEVIVDSPSHAKHPALMDVKALRDLFGVYRDRFEEHLKNPKIAMTMVYKNHGSEAGTSLEHPHSQIVGSSVVPIGIRHRMDEAEKYFTRNGTCVFCRMITEEIRQNLRVIADTKHFCAFILYAALSPFHIWVMPKRHTASFEGATPEEIDDLAEVMRGILGRLHAGLGDPPYNWVIQSTPTDRGTTDPFHWYLTLIVRTANRAGFELGSGMFINPSLPEENAKFLNSVKA